MSKIIVHEMEFHYAQYFKPVFEHVNLILDTDWRLSLIGRNGRGKTTFLKLLKGELAPDKGTITKTIQMEYFPYTDQTPYRMTLDVVKELIGGFSSMEEKMESLLHSEKEEDLFAYGQLQDTYCAAGGYEIEGRIRRELYLMGLSEELLVREFRLLSFGEQSKLRMIALFLRPNVFVLMDEPTNHLDFIGKKIIAEYLRQKNGFLAVSHDREFIDAVSDHILAINKTNITLEKGNYTSWKENVEKQEVFERRTKTRLEKEITKLEKGALVRREWAGIAEKEKNPYKTNNRGNGTRAAKFMRQAKNAQEEAGRDMARKKELLKNLEIVPELCLRAKDTLIKEETVQLLCRLENFTFGYGKTMLFEELTLDISKGERIWIKGPNGCGKSTLLKVICGQQKTECLKYDVPLSIAAVWQEPLWKDGFVTDKIEDINQWERFLELCDCLEITEEMISRPLETYSSGELGKIDIARALSVESDLLLLDEPLNYMDVYFREQLEKAILTFSPTLLFVEHDERFGKTVATRTILL